MLLLHLILITAIELLLLVDKVENESFVNKSKRDCPECDNLRSLIGSRNAKKGEMPYQVSIMKAEYDEAKNVIIRKHICSGVILNEDTIITAAHCVDCRDLMEGEAYQIAAGNNHLRNSLIVHRKIKAILLHPQNDGVPFNDIVLVKITPKLEFSDNIQSIKLARERPFKNELCTISGWSRLNKTYKPKHLQILNVHIEENDCKVLPNYKDGYILCAKRIKYEKNCLGDSGSPLTCDQILVGIASSLAGCHWGYPDIFMDISYYYNWINENHQFVANRGHVSSHLCYRYKPFSWSILLCTLYFLYLLNLL